MTQAMIVAVLHLEFFNTSLVDSCQVAASFRLHFAPQPAEGGYIQV